MKLLSRIVILVGGFGIYSCAHQHAAGSVVFRDSDKSAHVCMDHEGVNIGDKVKIYRNTCLENKSKVKCERTLIGDGKVNSFSDDHFINIESLGSLKLEQGDSVEKYN